MLDNETNQPSKFRTRNWVEIDDELGEDRLVTILNLKLILRSNLCNHADAYILVKGTITITGEEMMMQQSKQMREIKA